MKRRKRVLLGAAVLLAVIALAAVAGALDARSATERVAAAAEPYDIVITGGRVVDGTGNPWFSADVGIRAGRIAAIGALCGPSGEGCPARRKVDATGLYVAPGFIDMLGQSEITVLVDNRAESKIRQGITSEITGEGESVAPQNDKTLPEVQEGVTPFGIQVDWRTLSEYFARFERQGSAINLGTNVGAAQVRKAVLGNENRAPSPAELDQMRRLVAEAMQQGAVGISTALIYAPGTYAKTDELIELAKVAARYGGIYSSHMRNEGKEIFTALDETFRIGREARLPVHIYHLKVSGSAVWGKMGDVITRIERARAGGLEVTANMYAYRAGANGLSANLPSWALEGGIDKSIARLRDPATRAKIKEAMAGRFRESNAHDVLINAVANEKLRNLEGKRLDEIARERGKDAVDVMFDILIEDRMQTGQITFMMQEPDIERAFPQPWVAFGCDYGAVRPDGVLGRDRAHPRAYGNFPRLLARYTRDLHLLPLEQTIRKMTSLAAQIMRIEDRGVLRPGMWADVTLFDYAKVRDLATFEDPNRYSEGIRYVIVNGQLVLDDGKITEARPGRPIRGRAWTGSN
ncbi:MAG TPA: D-aminoacylase [Candidatus Acidoferrales bacterium]|nr:D-aminoacylase [Candidatus Acidoferrales bacterium]